MKFGKFIQGVAAEWATPHYLNYKALKKIIGADDDDPQQPGDAAAAAAFTTLAAPRPPAPADSPSAPGGLASPAAAHAAAAEHASAAASAASHAHNAAHGLQDSAAEQARKTAFFFRLERELEKVNAFYIQKEAEFKVRLRSLLDKKRILSSSSSKTARSSRASLRLAFVQFQNDLAKLQKFVEVNATGFRKILKKWDKRAKSSTKELYLSRQVEIQPCFNNDVLAELTDIAAANIVELEKQIESMDLDEQDTAVAANPQIIKSNLILDEAETELSKHLADRQHAQIVEFLQRRRASTLTADEPQFFSRLFLRFCAESSLECLQVLLSTGQVSINSVDDINDRSCLHEAAIAGRLDVIKVAIDYGAIVDIADVYGRRPLHYAAMHGHPDCASHLLSAGSPVDAIDHDGHSALVYAIIGGHTRCVQIFLDCGATFEPMSETAPIPISLACKYGNTEIVTLLLQRSAVLSKDSDGLDPLHMACREGHAEVAKLLIDHGANIESADPFNGWTPVFFSASEGHFACIKVLLAAGCRINVKDDSGWLPWTYALYRGHIQVANLLAVPDSELAAPATESGAAPEAAQPASVAPSAARAASGTGVPESSGLKPVNPASALLDDISIGAAPMEDLNIDEIPSLSLPPPIIPFRIYGHNYLEGKMNLQIHFGSYHANIQKSPIRLFTTSQLSSLKLVISSKPDDGVPYSVILPLKDELEVFTFMVDDDNDFSIQFDIYPTFGTKVIGRAVVLRSQFNQAIARSWTGAGESEAMICPLFDSRLNVVGEIGFEFSIVKPFSHAGLRIGGKIETYWKSTKVVANPKSGTDTVHSFVTASSLSEEYIQLVVQLTRDGIPVISPSWFIPANDVQIGLSHVTFAQARSLWQASRSNAGASDMMDGVQASSPASLLNRGQRATSADLAKIIYDSFLSLDEVLTTLPTNVGVHLSLKYPTVHQRNNLSLSELPDINTFVDSILNCVYNNANQRSIIFSSFNPSVCTAINWKQPNYGVFFGTHCGFSGVEEQAGEDRRCTSIKEAIKFAKSSNLLGLICEATPLVQMPVLINTVKESGLILATFGTTNNDPDMVKMQESLGVDALLIGRVFKYNT